MAPNRSRAPLVRVVVLNFNGGTDVVRCVDCLEHLDWPQDRLEVVVVDNASTDGSPAALRERFPRVEIIDSGGNLGFPANNLAMRDPGDADYVGRVAWAGELGYGVRAPEAGQTADQQTDAGLPGGDDDRDAHEEDHH